MATYNKKLKAVIIFFISIVMIVSITCIKKEHHKLSQFISPDTCGSCHAEIFKQWKNSMHHLAHKDPVYLKAAFFLRNGLTDADEIKEAESCVKCHVPIGYITGFPKTLTEEKKGVSGIAAQGIQCDYCHSATGARKLYNNGLQLQPGNGEDDPGTKRGPFKDAESDYHKSAFSKFHTGSKICGTCHDVKHVVFGTDLETTFTEWKNGPYNSSDPVKRVTCQGCHMYHRPGVPATGSTARPKNPGTAAEGSKKREHIFTHYFVGANSYVPGKFKDTIKAKMAVERLKNAAELLIDGKDISHGKLKIIVKNTGAGHYLPTGLTDFRQMWLEISIKDSRGVEIYSSGKRDKNNYIPDKTIIYNTVFGDGRGNPVVNVSKAREILKDRRVPPQGSLVETILFPVTQDKRLFIRVRLLYRIGPQKLLDHIAGKGAIKLPVVTMAEVKKTISLR